MSNSALIMCSCWGPAGLELMDVSIYLFINNYIFIYLSYLFMYSYVFIFGNLLMIRQEYAGVSNERNEH